MPRKVRTRATRQSNIDPAILAFLVDGDHKAFNVAVAARDLDPLLPWKHLELRRLWTEHREAILAEADRRHVRRPFGLQFDAAAAGIVQKGA